MIQRLLSKIKTLLESTKALRAYIALIVILSLAVFLILSYYKVQALVDERDDHKAEIEHLETIIAAQETTIVKERELRKVLKEQDSALTSQLLELKKADSLTQVRAIKSLMKQYSKLKMSQLDSLLIHEYEKAISKP